MEQHKVDMSYIGWAVCMVIGIIIFIMSNGVKLL